MKNLLLVLGFLLIPSVSFASPLTQDQANSLIEVVQSSPSTPASAFTNLITTFSNITVPQAESLITVVQASPSTPASAFVNMLIAFTVDTIAPVVSVQQQAPTFGNVTPVQNIPVETVNNSPLTITPVVQSVVMTPEIVVRNIRKIEASEHLPFGRVQIDVSVTGTDGKYERSTDVTITTPEGTDTRKTNNQYTNNSEDWFATFPYIPESAGVKSITLTSGTLTKILEITF